MTLNAIRLLSALLMLMALSRPGWSQETIEELEKRLDAKWKEVKSFSATMYMTAEIEKSGMTLGTTMTGPIIYERLDDGTVRSRSELKGKAGVGLLKLKTAMLTVNDGVTQYAESRVFNKISVTKSDARKRGSSNPGGGSKALTQASTKYDLRVLPAETLDGRQVDVIEGRPKSGQKAEFPGLDRLLMYFDRETGLQSKLLAVDKAGNKLTEVTFTDVVQNPPIDPSIFTYTIPKGAEVKDKTAEGGNT